MAAPECDPTTQKLAPSVFHERGVLVTCPMQDLQSRLCANLEQSILKPMRLADTYERFLITSDDSESGQHLGGRR
jgi:hypothetical protein